MDMESQSSQQMAAAAVVLENSDTNTFVCFSSLVILHVEPPRRSLVATPSALVALNETKLAKFGKAAIRPFVGELDYWARSLPGGVPITHSSLLSGVEARIVHKNMRDVDWHVGRVALVSLEENWRSIFPWMEFFRAEKRGVGAMPGDLRVACVDFYLENLNKHIPDVGSKRSDGNVSPAENNVLQLARRRRI